MFKILALATTLTVLGIAATTSQSVAKVQHFETTTAPMALANGVHVQKVTFPNKTITVVGNLFTPPNYDAEKQYPAIIITHPSSSIKEQTAGLYAQLLAEKGFITLAYDASYQGESGGEPRLIEDPATRVEDIRCAADFFNNHPSVKSIGALGICAGGGYTIHAAQTEARIQAVATVSAVDSGRTRREGLGGAVRYIGYVANSPEEIPATAAPNSLFWEGYEYYRTPRGAHPRSTNMYRFTSFDKMFEYTAFDHVDWISPRPLLLIAGSAADTLYLSRDAYNMAREPRELFIIERATHIDLYDKDEYVPLVVDKLADFFRKNL